MADAEIARKGLAQAMAQFPGGAARLHRLALIDRVFREICEEYGLAQESLARFEARSTPRSGRRSATTGR